MQSLDLFSQNTIDEKSFEFEQENMFVRGNESSPESVEELDEIREEISQAKEESQDLNAQISALKKKNMLLREYIDFLLKKREIGDGSVKEIKILRQEIYTLIAAQPELLF